MYWKAKMNVIIIIEKVGKTNIQPFKEKEKRNFFLQLDFIVNYKDSNKAGTLLWPIH
jgi:hypothetical protein